MIFSSDRQFPFTSILGKRKSIGKRGVQKMNSTSYNLQVIYCERNKKGGYGVRKDNVIHMHIVQKHSQKDGLLYTKPCLCGSFSHRSTSSLDCHLNVRYLDV